MPHRLAVLAFWSEEEGAPGEVSQHVDDFVNETQRGAEVKRLRQIAARQSNAVSRIAWKALLTVRTSPLAKDPWKQQVDRLVEKTPREVGFYLALADLRLPGFERQIDEALRFDNDELIHAATLAREATRSLAADGRKVAEMTAGEVAAAAMSGSGDPEVGRRLFTAQGCIACHSVDPKAEQKGPYLGSAGSKFTRDYLIESILEPTKVVAQGFQTSMLTLKDGTVHMGFVTAEADGQVELRNIAGQAVKVARAEVAKEEHLPQSMMPPGLAAALTVAEFTSLIDYLGSLRTEAE
jgi:putative heme-binding domain-containing protein